MALIFNLLLKLGFIILINLLFSQSEETIDHNDTTNHFKKENSYQILNVVELSDGESSSSKSFARNLRNWNPTINYFILPLTDEVKSVYENIKEFEFKNFSMSNYQTLKAHTVYVGTGKQSKAFDHAIRVSDVLSGQIDRALPIHWFLAKGFLQGMFKSILVAPFFGCSQPTVCAYREAATLWTHANQTMNGNDKKLTNKIIGELMADPENKEQLKNSFSKESLQLISDDNVERGIRQMSMKFSVEVPIGTFKEMYKDMENIHRRSAFRWSPESFYFYEFKTKVYSQNKNDGSVIMLPFEKIDFNIGTNKIVKKRLADDALYFMVKIVLLYDRYINLLLFFRNQNYLYFHQL